MKSALRLNLLADCHTAPGGTRSGTTNPSGGKGTNPTDGFAQLAQPCASSPLTLDRLLTIYVREVTSTKGESKQSHDRRAAKLFRTFFNSREDPDRSTDRLAGSLSLKDWNEFIQERRTGQIPGWEAVVRRPIDSN